ncbi:unnamed protein product [Pseudo-nitzschia multistriata]|uniref:Uncharacterized protein n=1 Tax=Pseudo-nitzschia multistriata TaxID=183589 RepID=A0A448ZR83_9STRA|nr:unnamed protein product [Pseudo-nitzschia multistriata]
MERENAEKQAIVDGLENQISDDAEKGRPAPGTAFHREAILEDEENNHAVGSGVGDDELEISEETLVDEVVVDSMSGEETTLHDTTLTDEEKSSGSQTETNLDEAQDDDFVDTQTVTDATPDAGTQIEAPNNSAGKEDLTMTNLAIESLRVLVKNAKDDVRRIINLAIPVLQPLLNAGDVAWQQMKSLFLRAREAYEAYQATNTAPIEGSEVADTCDDSIPA